MNKAGELFENAILHWRDAQGIGTALIPAPLNDKIMILGVLQRVYARSPTCRTLIITNNFEDRQGIIDFLTHQEEQDENNDEFKKLITDGYLKVFTVDFVNKNVPKYVPYLVIVYRPETFDGHVLSCVMVSRFKLIILNKLLSSEDMTKVYKVCPILDDFKTNEIEELRVSTPVEETRIGVSIDPDSEDFRLLNYYNEYISASISIFGSFDIMQQARTGNNQLNISANQICSQIAQENGWNEHLDMSVEFNVQIDNLYNPVSLRERASNTYEIIRKRSQLLSDYDGKLDEILKIIQDNPGKKILIINKRGEFASRVTEYINCCSISPICGNYHDKVDKVPMVDVYGNTVRYKSGAKKGEPRTMGADAQKTQNVALFNMDKLRVISTNNAPDKNLSIDVDIVIITSSQCESIKSYMYRLNNILFRSGYITLYNIYCKNTMEERLLDSKELSTNHIITNNCEKSVISEENSDFIIVD